MSIQRKRKIARRKKIDNKIKRALESSKRGTKKSKIYRRLEELPESITILSYLNDGFEKELYLASLKNLSDVDNPIRFNNFAYCMREIVELVIKRYSKNGEIRKCWWFKSYREKDPKYVSTSQQAKYAIQGGLHKDIVDEIMQQYDDEETIDKIILRFKDAHDQLNEHTHVGEKEFNIGDKACEKLASEVLAITSDIFYLVDHFRDVTFVSIKDRVSQELTSEFIDSTLDDIDILSTHSVIDHSEIDDFYLTEINSSSVVICGRGTAYFNLQWGSGSDMKRGDGAKMNESFPFTFELHANVNNIKELSVGGKGINVDTSSWCQ